ncbi:hypothetical protein BC829DRAFT_448832 [Chytridium lagenaria]|nr:hypothetical protein BC829DRAFT_448832 [Chytridium lagenaria]
MVIITEVEELSLDIPPSPDPLPTTTPMSTKRSTSSLKQPPDHHRTVPSIDVLSLLNLKTNPTVIKLQETLTKRRQLQTSFTEAVKLAEKAETDYIMSKEDVRHDTPEQLWAKARALEREYGFLDEIILKMDQEIQKTAESVMGEFQGEARELEEAKRVFGNAKTLNKFVGAYPKLGGKSVRIEEPVKDERRSSNGKKHALAELPAQPTIPDVEYKSATKKVCASWSCAFSDTRKVLEYEVSMRSAEGSWRVAWVCPETSCEFTPNVSGIISFRVRARNHVGWGVHSIARDVVIEETPTSTDSKIKSKSAPDSGPS